MYVKGDGETSRDFCFIKNVVQINIHAATADTDAKNQMHNVALGDRGTLKTALNDCGVQYEKAHTIVTFVLGRHSQADIS